MAKQRVLMGEMSQGDRANWSPLEQLLGDELCGDFMWMFEVQLNDGTRLDAYKHIDTRRYVHLSPDGVAFVYEDRERYRTYPVAEVLDAVFRTLPGLAGVTDRQLRASRDAVDRLRSAGQNDGPLEAGEGVEL